MIAVLSIYLFIVVGFIAKKAFKELNEKSFVIISVYFLQPFLTLWGLTLKPLNLNSLYAPSLYLGIIFISLIFTSLLALFVKKDERSIAIISALITNTGNLGIPLSYALWGADGAFYATILNLTNMFFVYTFGIFFYAGRFSIENTKKILKIPIIHVGIIALIINYLKIDLSPISQMLQMGAYSSMVIQLIIFGIYTANIKIKKIPIKLTAIVSIEKFIIVPIIGYLFLSMFKLDPLMLKVVLLEVSVPIAVNNVNLAALFDNKPEIVAWLIIFTSILFIPFFYIVF